MTSIFSRLDGRTGNEAANPRPTIARFLAILLFLLVSGCRRPGDPATQTVQDLARAARDRDAAAFLDLVAPDFEASDGSRKADLEPTIRQFFTAWESLDVTIRDLKVERSEGAALARFQVNLSGRARKIAGLEGLLPSSSSWKFETRIAPSENRWRVKWASWSPAP